MRIFYKAGYKYQLHQDYAQAIPVSPAEPVFTPYLTLTTAGILLIKAGYAWDGPSGPTIDSKNFMRGSLVHDALYQLIRLGKLPFETKQVVDELLYSMCLEDGMSRLRASWVLLGVRLGGVASLLPKAEPEVRSAP